MKKYCENPLCSGKGKSQSRMFVIEPPPEEAGDKPLFRAVYTIDVNAEGPRQAAECAYKLMTDPESWLPVLHVMDASGYSIRIDMAEGASDENYCSAAEYLAEKGRKIFTGPMYGGLWNARCMDASIASKKQGNKFAYEMLLKFGDEYAGPLKVAQQKEWKDIKDKAASILQKGG